MYINNNCSIILINVLSEIHIFHAAAVLGLMSEATWTAVRAILASSVDENEIGNYTRNINHLSLNYVMSYRVSYKLNEYVSNSGQ